MMVDHPTKKDAEKKALDEFIREHNPGDDVLAEVARRFPGNPKAQLNTLKLIHGLQQDREMRRGRGKTFH